jgi:hypothetical protein
VVLTLVIALLFAPMVTGPCVDVRAEAGLVDGVVLYPGAPKPLVAI